MPNSRNIMMYMFIALFFGAIRCFAGAADCSWLTPEDISQILQAEASAAQIRQGMMPAGTVCTYRSADNQSSLKFKYSSKEDIKKEGLFESAEDIITRQRKARKNNAYAKAKMQERVDIGDDALWDGTNLWLRQGETLLLITVQHHSARSFTDTDQMEKELQQERLTLSLKVAEKLIHRLEQ